MQWCLAVGWGVGFCGGIIVFFHDMGSMLAGVEALLLFVISGVCFCTLAVLAELERAFPSPSSPAPLRMHERKHGARH